MDRPVPDGAAIPSMLAGSDAHTAKVQFDLENLHLPSVPSQKHGVPSRVGSLVTASPDDRGLNWVTPAPHRQTKHFQNGGPIPAASLQQDFERWEPLIRSKDSILQQKDMTIQRLQREVSLLQQQCHESEVRMQQVIRKQVEGDGAVLSVKLSEAQNDLALAHASAEQTRKQTERGMSLLKSSLGKVEYSLCESQKQVEALQLREESHAAEVEKLISSHEEAMQGLKLALKESEEREETTKQRVVSLERYLTKVPTPQEVQKSTEAMSVWREKCESAEQESKSTKKCLEEREAELKQMQEDLEQAKAQVSALLQLQSGRVQEQFAVTTNCSKEELHAVLLQCDAQCAEFRSVLEKSKLQAAADLEKVRQRYKQLYARATVELQKELKLLKQQADEQSVALAEEKACSAALKRELSESQTAIADLRTNTTQLVKQNQDLLDHSLQLEQAHHQQETRLRSLSSESVFKLRSVHHELSLCVAELRNLIQVWKSFLEGQDPDMSSLLGLPACAADLMAAGGESDDAADINFMQQLDEQCASIKSLRTDIDALRSLLADQYAQEIGTSCPIQ